MTPSASGSRMLSNLLLLDWGAELGGANGGDGRERGRCDGANAFMGYRYRRERALCFSVPPGSHILGSDHERESPIRGRSLSRARIERSPAVFHPLLSSFRHTLHLCREPSHNPVTHHPTPAVGLRSPPTHPEPPRVLLENTWQRRVTTV